MGKTSQDGQKMSNSTGIEEVNLSLIKNMRYIYVYIYIHMCIYICLYSKYTTLQAITANLHLISSSCILKK